MKRILLFLIIIISDIISYNTCLAQESLIDIALRSKKSIVTVYAIQFRVIKSPKASAAIDARSGRILFARKIKAAQAEKKGAGVIINPAGLIVTNLHVVSGAQQIIIKLFKGKKIHGKLVYIMPSHDLALIKITPPFRLKAIEFADSNNISLGQDVVQIGSSDMLKETISGGKIIGMATSSFKKKGKKNVELIEVNINIYKGDSGGPILDREGRLVGMLFSKLRNKQKAAFAIPSNKIKKLYLKAAK